MSTTPEDPFARDNGDDQSSQPDEWGGTTPQVAAPLPEQTPPPAPFTQPQYAQPQYAQPQYAQPQYAQPGYDQAQYQHGYPQPYGGPNPRQAKNWMGIVSLVASLSTFITGVGCIVGIVFGHLALSAVKKGEADNRGLALGGLISGYVFLGLGLLGFLAYALFVGFVLAGGSGY